MAGDWIKMRTSLLTNPRVNRIARDLEQSPAVAKLLAVGDVRAMSEVVTRDVMRHVTASALFAIWVAANDHTRDGMFRNADLSYLDDIAGVPGIGVAMESVGWAIHDRDANTVTLPDFNEYNTTSSRRGAGAKSAAERQKEYRERKKQAAQAGASTQDRDVTGDVTAVTTSDRREEEKREDKKTPNGVFKDIGASTAEPLPPTLPIPPAPPAPPTPPAPPAKAKRQAGDYSADFEAAWAAYPDRPGKSKADAWKAWSARINAGAAPEALLLGVERYAAYCVAEGTEPLYIKQPATFFGPGEHYLSDWTPALRRAPQATPAQARREQKKAWLQGLINPESTTEGERDADRQHGFIDAETRVIG